MLVGGGAGGGGGGFTWEIGGLLPSWNQEAVEDKVWVGGTRTGTDKRTLQRVYVVLVTCRSLAMPRANAFILDACPEPIHWIRYMPGSKSLIWIHTWEPTRWFGCMSEINSFFYTCPWPFSWLWYTPGNNSLIWIQVRDQFLDWDT